MTEPFPPLTVPGPSSSDLADQLVHELASAWERGERLPAEKLLERCPKLLDCPEEAVRVIYEEICLRQENGEEIAAEEYCCRFPRWTEELGILLNFHRLVQLEGNPPQFPSVGESLGEFHLVAELGRGSQGIAFLATQTGLADRLVVLKVMQNRLQEHVALARLQHTHIIPLYAMYDYSARDLRGMCIPYLGGTTFARILDLIRDQQLSQRTGRSLLEALDLAQAESPYHLPRQGSFRQAFAQSNYAEAVCAIGACLAEGLHHAHERNLVHLDLKPSNVLLAADAQPLLLDFHLALYAVPAGQAAPDWFGGTPGFMSPEQERACVAARLGRPVPEAVDKRSDIWSLGRLLYVALAGPGPVATLPAPPLHRLNPQVSVGLSDLIQKCLSPNPADRYPSAGRVAADLRRHLANLPLQGVRNRNLPERWRKWCRRRPNAPLWVGLLLALAAAGLALTAGGIERYCSARRALEEGQGQLQRGAYGEAIHTLSRGQEHLDCLPGVGSLAEKIETELRLARRAQAAVDLHALAEKLRFLAGAEIRPGRESEDLEAHCRQIWETRRLVADQGAGSLKAAMENQIRIDLLDLTLLWANLKSKLFQARGLTGDLQETQMILAEAEELLGPCAVLAWQRQLLSPAGDRGIPLSAVCRSPWEHVALGQALLCSGRLEQANQEFDQAADLSPQNFWANFFLGVCAYRLQRYGDAVHSFGIAIALAPSSAECYYNRALAHVAWGKKALALRDYDRALTLAPGLGVAALNRSILHYQEGRLSAALEDVQRALLHGAEPAAAHFNLALVHLARKDQGAACRHLDLALTCNPGHTDARALRERIRRQQ